MLPQGNRHGRETISTGPTEGSNNKIKAFKREFGYRNQEFVKLGIPGIHEAKGRENGPTAGAYFCQNERTWDPSGFLANENHEWELCKRS